ncbi:MAG: hypothetical protein CM1200mP2_43640 [Planctomycetaceae bacterium]|nr:MAG: hypothetical protein CM1200mP2_43640 [Planctomycetaceae bacterium]
MALDAKTGKVSWQQDVITSLKGRVADYGMACSPLVVGDLVVVTPGAPRAAVAAYNLSDGESAWTAGSGSAGYSSPTVSPPVAVDRSWPFSVTGPWGSIRPRARHCGATRT